MYFYRFPVLLAVLLTVLLTVATGCTTTKEVRDMPLPQNLEQAEVQLRTMVVALRKLNATMLNMQRYKVDKAIKIKAKLDCVKSYAIALKGYVGLIGEPKKLLESQNMLQILLLMETQQFGGTYELNSCSRPSG